MPASRSLRHDSRGFTLVEMLIAVVILSFVLLGLGTASGRLAKNIDTHERQTAAIQLAQDRLTLIQLDPGYDSLDMRYEGVEDSFPTLSSFVRTTEEIVLVGGPQDTLNHKKITVTVEGGGLPQPVSRTVTIAAP